eukprot:1157837-Pelagomonas_calceolata.AAC.6
MHAYPLGVGAVIPTQYRVVRTWGLLALLHGQARDCARLSRCLEVYHTLVDLANNRIDEVRDHQDCNCASRCVLVVIRRPCSGRLLAALHVVLACWCLIPAVCWW